MMNILIEVYKNGNYTTLPEVEVGFPIREALDETLDQATLMFRSKNEAAVEIWQSVRITIDDYQRFFLVADIQSDLAQSGDHYKFIVALIEPTKYLEKVICPSMSFTNKNMSLGEQIECALLNAEPVEVGSEPRFKLNPAAKAYLSTIPGADFFFEKMTLKEILNGFFSQIDSRCTVKEITDYNNIVIDFYSLNKRGKKINLLSYGKRKTVQNIELMGSDIESYADNALATYTGPNIHGRRVPIYHPSPNGWDTFKTNEDTLTTENAVISAAFPIEEITNFWLPGPFILTGSKDGSDYTLIVRDILDINRNVLNEEEYAVLKEVGTSVEKIKTDKFYKQNTIHYTRGNTDIRNLRYPIFFGLKSDNLVYAAENVFWNSDEVTATVQTGEYETYTISSPASLGDVAKALFQITYIPQVDAHLKIGKESYAGPPATIISQQSDKIIDVSRYGDNLYGLVNRVGNKELYIDQVIDFASELYELGDYTDDNYILTSREFATYNDFIKVHYGFTKNFNALSTKIGIDRRKRVFNIPLECFRSDTLIKEYIVAWFGSPSPEDKIINLFMYTFKTAPGLSHITNALIRTYWTGGQSEYLELPVIGYAAANAVNFHFKFRDNFSAGMSIGNQVIGGKKVIPNPYVNENGEYEQIEINLFNDSIKSVATDELARARLLPKTSLDQYNANEITFSKTYQRKKDAYEHHSFTVCFEIKSLEDDIIIGPALAENCALWYTTVPKLSVYVSSCAKYSKGAKKILGVKASNQSISVQNGYISVSFSDANIQSWAIGDVDGNLYIACNRPTIRTIQFQRRKTL